MPLTTSNQPSQKTKNMPIPHHPALKQAKEFLTTLGNGTISATAEDGTSEPLWLKRASSM